MTILTEFFYPKDKKINKFSKCKFLFLQSAPFFMLLGHKLVNAAQTKIILSNIGSTWVLSDATWQVCVVPLADRRVLDSGVVR